MNIEAHANLVYTLLYIANNTKHKSLKKLCLDSLEGADKESLEELAKYHRQQGITMALFEIQNKMTEVSYLLTSFWNEDQMKIEILKKWITE